MSKQNEKELLPCPFCGGTPQAYGPTDPSMGMKLARVECECGIGTANFETQAEAIAFWNDRQNGPGPSSGSADVMRLTWSEQTPSEEGWYWYKEEGCEKKPIEIERSNSFYNRGRMRPKIKMKYNGRLYLWVDWAPGEWAGPIPEPKEVP